MYVRRFVKRKTVPQCQPLSEIRSKIADYQLFHVSSVVQHQMKTVEIESLPVRTGEKFFSGILIRRETYL
jgi:hypothetical protein